MGLCGDSLIEQKVAPGGFAIVAVGAIGVVFQRDGPCVSVYTYDIEEHSGQHYAKELSPCLIVADVRELSALFPS